MELGNLHHISQFGSFHYWEISSSFGKIQAIFPLGLGPKFGPKTDLKNP